MNSDRDRDKLIPIERGDQFTRHLVTAQPRIRGFIFSLVGDQTATDDILQEVSTVLWRKFDQFEPCTNFTSWALSIARFSVLEWRRQQKRVPLPLEEETLHALADEAEAFALPLADMREPLRLCLTQLSPRQQQLITERYLRDEPVQSIATRWQRTRMAIYKLLNKTHQQLLLCLRTHA
ncbi:sigma-70 family RNA polymerase sigma factor [Roseibacillus persicicus]|uniref:sigma-70 family RNA polymerase sigma factor n=1 Tax=Roseibacillus persicicus TaxID=454148 RepID=UPI00398B47A2